ARAQGVRADRLEEGALPGRPGGGARRERPLRRGGAVGGAGRGAGPRRGEGDVPKPAGDVPAGAAVARGVSTRRVPQAEQHLQKPHGRPSELYNGGRGSKGAKVPMVPRVPPKILRTPSLRPECAPA